MYQVSIRVLLGSCVYPNRAAKCYYWSDNIMGKFAGKSVFLTGVTGFMGKVLMEKVLRCLDTDTVYVLIRAKRGKSVSERLEKILEAPVSQIIDICL